MVQQEVQVFWVPHITSRNTAPPTREVSLQTWGWGGSHVHFHHSTAHRTPTWFLNPERSLEFQRIRASVYMSLWEYGTKISSISFSFLSKPASPVTSQLLFQVLPFVQGPSSNTLSHPPPPLGLPSKLQRCSIQGPPLLPIHVHISLVWILSHLYLLWVVTSSLVLPPLVRLYTHLVKGQIHPQNVQLQPHHWSTPKSSAVLRAS